SLNHPNIGGIYDVVEEKGLRALVLELVDGETLAERLSRAGKAGLPLQEALSIAIQIADALAAAHRIGIVHRDLKPSNVILAKAGGARQGSPQAKLLDFGIAKLLDGSSVGEGITTPTIPPLTAQGMLLGTTQYMAPEQLEGREVSTRSDLFAFGAV